MQISSTAPARRARAKAKDDPQDALATLAPALRKPRPRKKATAPVAAAPAIIAATSSSQDAVASMIATTAYFLAAQRNFAPGQELDDWLAAERQVRRDLTG